MIQQMLAIWFLVPLPFLNPARTSGSSQFTYCWSLTWRILSITFLAYEWVQLCGSLNILCSCPLGLEWKLTFSNPVATAEFSKFAGILSAASSFRIWNSSAGILSPPLALFVAMLPKAHLTSHSTMSGSRWVITPSWLFASWRSFLYSSSVYSYHLFLISSASVRYIPFLSLIVPIFAWNIPLVSLIFLKRSMLFAILLFSSIPLQWPLRKAFLYSPCYSLELCIQMDKSFILSFAFHFSFHRFL